MIKKKPIFILLVAILVNSCSSSKTISDTDDLAYADKIKDLNPKYTIYHHQENESLLYFQLSSKELLYVRENISQPFASSVSIHYKLYSIEDKKTLLDSATNMLIDKKKSNSNKKIIGKIPIPVKMGGEYRLSILATDVNKNVSADIDIVINKKDLFNKQFFLLEKPNKEICFDSYFTKNETIKITSKFNPTAKLKVNFYKENKEIAPPPFSTQTESYYINKISDSTMPLQLTAGTAYLEVSKRGNYYIYNQDNKSFTIHYITQNFPKVIDYEGMIEPIRFICTNAEYKKLKEATDKRQAVEDFWLKMGGNKERAKILIREYYRRIYLANKYFTSYKEGWRTDRGMLSIVMGYPNTISTNNRGETWIYGTASNMMMSLSFSFDKLNTQFVSNDYQLDRYRTYKDYWYRAVENWRQGRVYSFN